MKIFFPRLLAWHPGWRRRIRPRQPPARV